MGERLQRIVANALKQLGPLSPSQKLLIGSLAVIMLMALFLVTQYAGRPQWVELMPGAPADEQQRAAAFLRAGGTPVEISPTGNVSVPGGEQYLALAALSRAQLMPSDKTLLFANLAEQQDWLKPKGVQDQMFMTALANELARVIAAMPGIDRATVFLSNPEPRGLGSAARTPTAQVTVFPAGSAAGLDQPTVDAIADVIAGSLAGLDARNVSVVDGTNRRRHRASGIDDFAAATYSDQVSKVEARVQQKILEHLGVFIGEGLVVSVNAIVDAARRESTTTSILPRKQGSESLPIEEQSTASTSTSGSRGAAPGIASNIEADITRGGGTAVATSDETGTNRYENKFGERTVTQRDAIGRPTRINVAVSVPREYVAEVVRQRSAPPAAPAAAPDAAAKPEPNEPTEQELAAAWSGAEGLEAQLVKMITPLIETEAASSAPGAAVGFSAGSVVVSMMPVALLSGGAGAGGARNGAGGVWRGGTGGPGGAGSSGGIGGLVNGETFRQALLLGLAATAIGMMFILVRKAGKPAALPTAEELVGIPPAIEADSDLVGEADQTETPMIGIEIDSDALKTTKMLEEVQQLVKSNPTVAATVFNRWLAPQD